MGHPQQEQGETPGMGDSDSDLLGVFHPIRQCAGYFRWPHWADGPPVPVVFLGRGH